MRQVKIQREELIKILKENRKQHIRDFEQNLVDYKSAAIKITNENLRVAITGDLEKISSQFKTMPSFPVSHEESYNRVIRMLELHTEEVIELDHNEFDQLVMDKWPWKQQFVSNLLACKKP